MIKCEDSDIEEVPITPPAISPEPDVILPDMLDVEEGTSTTLNSLPGKSRKKYEREYDLFLEWRKQNNVQRITENVLLRYFTEKAKDFKSSSLWSQFSMLKATLMVKDHTNIGKCPSLIAFLKSQSAGYKAKSTKTFTRAEINKFLLQAPDEYYLLMKVALIMGIAGACRRDELCKMKVDDIQDAGTVLIVKIPSSEARASRTFIVTGETDNELNPIQIYRKYAALRPAHTEHRRFFLYYKCGKCSVQVVGINTFSKIPCHIAKFLQIPDAAAYTGQCFRKTSASLLATSGADILSLERHGGWKTTRLTRSCTDVFMEESSQISSDFETTMPLISTSMGTGYSEVFIEEHPPLTVDFDSSTMSLIPEMDIKVEKKNPDKEEEEKKAVWEKTNTLPSNTSKFAESPKSVRKRFGSASEETILKVNGLSEVSGLSLGPTEIESLKNEIVKEVRKEISKMKQDIIDAIKSELNRR